MPAAMSSPDIRKILVRGTNWLGDAVMTIPALEQLRASFPQTQITLLAPPRAAEVFSGFPHVDEVVPYLRKEKGRQAFLDAMRFLRNERYDLAILFQNAFEAALLAFLGGVKVRIGYDTQGRGALLTHKLQRLEAHRNRHQTHDYLDVVAEAERVCLDREVVTTRQNIPSLIANRKQIQAADALLRRAQIDSQSQQLIALNVGATNSRAKCWPEDRFAALADRLVAELNARIVLIGAGSERADAEHVIAQMKHKNAATNLAGETSIAELIGLLARCDLVVTNDTGPAHVAAALNKPTLTIFGPTNEFETAPLGTHSALIRVDDIDCARCMHRDCPIDHRCMTRLHVDAVATKAFSLLEEL
ncbi:MAG: lipopolysaccharide heptosyltransferase II [Acidobacteria bacterium]|nr:lipopolysaccharide heptosyltransferase II [Acidobacteriota bacterium]